MSLLTLPNAREQPKSVRATVLVFKDPRSQELLNRIERLAPSEANALIIVPEDVTRMESGDGVDVMCLP